MTSSKRKLLRKCHQSFVIFRTALFWMIPKVLAKSLIGKTLAASVHWHTRDPEKQMTVVVGRVGNAVAYNSKWRFYMDLICTLKATRQFISENSSRLDLLTAAANQEPCWQQYLTFINLNDHESDAAFTVCFSISLVYLFVSDSNWIWNMTSLYTILLLCCAMLYWTGLFICKACMPLQFTQCGIFEVPYFSSEECKRDQKENLALWNTSLQCYS